MLKKYSSILCLIALTFSVSAQTTLQETVVTASKYPQKQENTSKVLTILNDSILKANSFLTVGQLLNQQVGVVTVGAGQTLGSTQYISMRGSSFGMCLLLIDGQPVNEPSGIGNTFDINFLHINQIDRIEILKGGQSTLYGSDAVAGVINIITKKGESEKMQSYAALSIGNFKTIKGNVNVNGTIEKTRYQFGLGLINSDGFSSADEPQNSTVKFKNNDFRSNFMNARVTQQLHKNLDLSFFVRSNDYKSFLDYAAFVDEDDYISKNKNVQFGGEIEFRFNKSKININAFRNKSERNYIDDSTQIVKDSYYKYFESNYKSKADFAEIFFTKQVSSNINLLAGIDYRIQSMSYNSYYEYKYGWQREQPINNQKINNGSAYYSVSIKQNQNFGLDFGGRINYHSIYTFNNTASISSYYVLNNNFKFFGSAGSSYRNPALYQIFSLYGNKNLEPETSQEFELGTQWSENQSKIRLIYYFRNMSNVIFFNSFSYFPYGEYVNQNNEKNNGIELEAATSISKVKFSANYTFLNGNITDFNTSKTPIKSALLRKPKHSVNVNANFAVNSKISLQTSAQYFSKRNDQYFNPKLSASEIVKLKEYVVLHANLNYKHTPKRSYYIALQNLTNTKYNEIYGFKSRPFSVEAGFNFQF